MGHGIDWRSSTIRVKELANLRAGEPNELAAMFLVYLIELKLMSHRTRLTKQRWDGSLWMSRMK